MDAGIKLFAPALEKVRDVRDRRNACIETSRTDMDARGVNLPVYELAAPEHLLCEPDDLPQLLRCQ